jgi:branched-chain amino acid aminotransferase
MSTAASETPLSAAAEAAVPHCWLNGAIIPLAEASVGITDIGLLRGFGIYEGLITHNGKPFMLADHLERFHRSAAKMALTIPIDDAQIAQAIAALVAKNVASGKEALIRIILTGGPAVGVIEYDPKTPTMFILAEEFKPLESRYLEQGCTVTVVDYHRDLADIKSINYIKTVLLQEARKAHGALEIVYTSGGQMLEGGGSNVFIVKNGTLITPKDEIVLGITRKAVLDLARGQMPVEERPVSVEEFYGADEVFITGSFKEIVPVVSADGKAIGGGAPGRVTKQILALFHDFTRSY